ncbi:MAG TPA: amidase [Pirellulales bacterium]|nr:amidase [Pirellulales bacterium]
MKRPPTILEAAAEMRQGRPSASELLDQCLANVERFEPRVRAWVMLDEAGARETARRLDEERKQGRNRGPLHGIPVGIKDIVDVAGWPTKAGSPLREGHRAERDATLVARLRAAGAVILGKTVTTQFASFDPPPTRNPWNLERTPGGSSSGSAAAVAAGMCLAAIGSQTGGSITRPASYCGVAGCKPTWGRVSSAGLVPFSFHLDQAGPIARCVADLAIIVRTIAGYDPADPVCQNIPLLDDKTAPLDQPPKIGLLEEYFFETASESVRQVTRRAVDRLRSAGMETQVVALPASFADAHRYQRLVMAVDAAAYHRDNFPSRREQYAPNIALVLDEGRAATAVEYSAALAHQFRFRREMSAALEGFDALLTPATNATAQGPETTGDPRFNVPWSYSGQPTVSFPCGLADESMPVALQLIGRPFDEAALFAAAAWCEQILEFAGVPQILDED